VPDVDPTIPCPIDLPEKDRPVLLTAISIKPVILSQGIGSISEGISEKS